jgi:hypothetical protein
MLPASLRQCRPIALLVASALALPLGCTTTELASQPSARLGNIEMTNNVLDTNISVDTSRKLSGEATESVLFGFLPLTSPVRCATGVVYNPDSNGDFRGDSLTGRAARVRAAAAYNAVIGKADLLVAPQWSVTEENNLFVTKYTARVSGYPGTIRSIVDNTALSHRPVSAVQAYEDSQRAEERDRDDRCCPPPPAPRPEAPAMAAPAVAADVLDKPSPGAVTDPVVMPGPVAASGDTVRYHYTCSLEDGRVLFDSRDKGAPRTRVAGGNDVPTGLGQALIGMHAGEQRRVVLPPSQAFGSAGLPNLGIPPDSTVVFDIYVEDIGKR